MSKEREAAQARSVPPQYHHGQQHQHQQPGQGYNSMPHVNPAFQQPGVVPAPCGNPIYQPSVVVPATNEKSVVEAYLVWLIFGLIGGHHFYLGRYGFGVLYFFTFGLCGVGFVIDMFRMPCLVSMVNKQRKEGILDRKKNLSDAYTLWFPMGIFGVHHHYLGNHGLGVFYLFTGGGFGIGWLVDLFRMPSMVRNYNRQSKFERDEKHVCTAYIIAASPAGLLGYHHFYLRRPLWGLLYFLTFGLLGVGWIVDWFRVPVLVKRKNKEIAEGKADETKYVDDAYTLWFPFGLIGLHHFYLERWVWGLLYFLTFGMLGLGWIVDGFRMVCLVNEVNRRKNEQRLLPAHGTPTTYVIAQPYTGNFQGVAVPQTGNPGLYPQVRPEPAYPVNPPSYQENNPRAPVYSDQPPPYSNTDSK